ncbi:hypothetical protein PsorP6_007858 [Peronosclerospora sorghi]|uniref:Uncharacterized protein n=1 Tax=Peronosclerospora sorghi TaxID=230839 RepID=A0ACC0WA22_9STRA|nr:hypothetical protein PsorP6_007858 [Peronosclerospora sorghi]
MSADVGGHRRSYRSIAKQRPATSRLSSDERLSSHVSLPSHSTGGGHTRPSLKKPPASGLEEGDFVWVDDESGVCTSAVVVRTGFVFDDASEQEQHVIVVHTEDGEERAFRDRPLVKLPTCHHPKQVVPLELHDLSNVPLMATNGDTGRTETFTSKQLENVVLYTLRARYRMEQVYTWVDRVLVGVNPVTPLPIYTPDHMQAYNKSREQTPLYEKDTVNDAPPHVFALAQNALRCMQDAGEDQAVVLLGGMGAGKSEAAKLIVQYLCEIGDSAIPRQDANSDAGVLHPIGQQILHAFTILEAFGNAATPLNPNSSRFAKMISVEFNKQGNVIGGGFTTHYFEKSRIVESKGQERNFHILYQVLAGVQHDPTLRDALELNTSVAEFELLKHADPKLTNYTLDARDYRDLMSSFSALRIRKNQRVEIVRIVAALLHLGNVDFVADPEASKAANGASTPTVSDAQSCVLKDAAQLMLAAKLLEVEPVVLDNYFRTRQFFSKDGTKTVSSLKVVTVRQARKARDTFIRSLYESLFDFLVETLNGILGGIFDRYEKSNIVINSQGVHVFDMVGFENLEPAQNSFDQLCFNYWSEKVHHFYTQNTLAISLSDLEDESQQVENRLTVHSKVDITSEQEQCLQLFEDKPFGIFDLLTENGKMRSPSDEDFVNKLFSGNEAVGGLSRPNMGVDTVNEYLAPSKDWRLMFVIQHHCGKVTYNGKGLSAKNALTISSTCAAIMQSSKNAVLRAVGAAQMAAMSSEKAAKQAGQRGSTSSKFRSSISSTKESKGTGESSAADMSAQADALLHALAHTGKNFFVCIKPSEELEPGVFDSGYVMKQIRYNHLVELMQASRSIFTVHLTYGHFFRRYKNVCGHRGTLESLLRSLSAIGVLDEEKFVVGKTKVFLTSHQWKQLEKARFLYLNACATMIQRNMLRGGFRKKSARLLYVMRGLREAMAQRDQNYIIQHLANCNQIVGKRASEDIRVLNEARQLIARLDEEAYVNSIIADATRINHPVLIEYAVRVAEKSSPWLPVDHLRRRSKSIVTLQRQKAEKLAQVNTKLRNSIIGNDPEALMGSLATLDEPSVESLERKLATMMIIRALEEKSAVESVTQALATVETSDKGVVILDKVLVSATKALSLGVEAKLAVLVDTLKAISNDQVNEHEQADQQPQEDEERHEEEQQTVASAVTLSTDPVHLIAALQKALDDENYFAVERVLVRLQALGVPEGDPRTAQAKQALEAHTVPASAQSERKQMVKFLAVAKLAKDVELLTEAIAAATTAGLAKWDFNLKNAEREREKLLATAAAAAPAPQAPARVDSPPPKPSVPVTKEKKEPAVAPWNVFLQIWEAAHVNELEAVRASVDSQLQAAFEAKMGRLQQVASIQDAFRQALETQDAKDVEQALSQSISLGFCSPLFAALFEHHAMLRSRGNAEETSEEAEMTYGLHAVIHFLTHRVEANAEIRQDAVQLLSNEIEEFSSPGSGDKKEPKDDDAERDQVLETAGNLRKRLEARIAAATRLESTLELPTDASSVSALELSLEHARDAGIHERLLMKAEEKLAMARRRSVDRLRSSGLGINLQNDSASSERSRCDTTEWPRVAGDDESAEDTCDKKSKHHLEKDALAFNQFENLRGFNAQSDTAMAKKLCWESRAISQSLSVLDENPDDVQSLAISASAGQLALSINRCILGYMRDRIVFYREMLAHYILQIGLMKPSLVDEIYLQLMKQLTKNPKRDSSIRGWSLFALCATSFPPSLALQKYVIMFLKAQVAEMNSFWRLVRNFAAYSLKKLENLLENGATGFIPSMDEIRGYEARPPFLATIQLLDGTPLAEAFPVTPELTVAQLIEICSHFLGLEDHVVNFLGLTVITERVVTGRSGSTSTSGGSSFVPATVEGTDPAAETTEETSKDGAPAPVVTVRASSMSLSSSSSPSSYFHKFMATPPFLNAKVYLGDIFEKELIRGRDVRFVLKIRLNPLYMLQYTDEMYDRLVYIQVQDEIVKGNLPGLEHETLLRLTALAIAVDCQDGAPASVEDVLEMGILDYLPLDWRPAHDEEEWADLVLDTITDNFLDDQDALYPVGELQRLYIEEVTRHRLYGACFFPSKLVHRGAKRETGVLASLGIELPTYFVIAVNGSGLHFLGRDGSMLGFCEYADIAYCSGAYPQYKICLQKASDAGAAVDELVLTTKYTDELDAVIADYKEITALMNEA